MRIVLIGLIAAAASVTACNCGGPVCGAGTHLVDNKCVADNNNGNEGEGEGGGEGEGAGVQCGAGTVPSTDGTTCVAKCTAPQVFDDVTGQCACPPGQVASGTSCVVDPALCAAGTVFDSSTDTCVPASADARGDDETNGGAPVLINVPDIGAKPFEVGGVVDHPQGGVPDLDTFQFDGTAGQHLRISVVSFGAPSTSFVLVGTRPTGADNNLGAFQRFGLAGAGRTAFREVVLPLDGTYQIVVADESTFAGGLPVGGDDFTYNLVIEQLAPIQAQAIAVATPETGTLGLDAWHVDENAIAAGSFVDAIATLDDTTGSVNGSIWFVTQQGVFVQVAGEALLPQPTGGVVLHPDFVFTLDSAAPLTYSLTVNERTVDPAPPVNTGLADANTNGDQLTFFSVDIAANDVYRIRAEFPQTTTVVDPTFAAGNVVLVNSNLQQIGVCTTPLTPFDAANPDNPEVECRVFGSTANVGTAFFVVIDGTDEGVALSNNQLKLSVDEAAVLAPITMAVNSAPVNRTSPAPATSDLDAWAGPWFQVAASDIETLNVSSGTGQPTDVLMNVFDETTLGQLDTLVPQHTQLAVSGTTLLVQTVGGAGGGNFNFHVDASAPGFLVETEPNNTSAQGNALAEGTAAAIVGGMTQGDQDFFTIVVTDGGELVVTLTSPPPPLTPGDVQVDIIDTDGSTPIGSPGLFTPSDFFFTGTASAKAFVQPGTYFARITFVATVQTIFGAVPGAPGGYSVSWSVDTTAHAPGSCAAPELLDPTAGIVTDDTSLGEATFTPSAATCTGQAPAVYSGKEAAFSIFIPDGDTLIATATSTDFNNPFDPAMMLVAGSCETNNVCLAGVDTQNVTNTLTFHNTTGADIDGILVVDGVLGAGEGPFTLQVALIGSVCQLGASTCDSSGNISACNADGTGFDTIACAGGCAFDSFNERAACNKVCGPTTSAPDQFCSDGATLQTCAPDGTAYVPTTCAGDCNGDATAGFCTFGLCSDAQLGTTTCVTQDVNGDQTNDTFLLTCNADASVASLAACDQGAACNADGVTCDNAGTLQTICTASTSTCTNGVASTCNATGDAIDETFCALGCDQTGTACVSLPFGDNCQSAGNIAFPADGASIEVSGTIDGNADDFDPTAACPFGTNHGSDVVTSFTATESTSVTLVKAGFDGIMYRFADNTCGAAVAQCVDDFQPDPNLDTMTFNATAGTTYFIGIEPFFGTGGSFTLTLTNNPG